jgi:atypical dual specificity phosphatase
MQDSNTLDDFERRYSVVSQTLAGSAAPGVTGRPISTDRHFLEDRGVIAIVSLSETELEWAALAPLAHLRERVEDYRAPTIEQMLRIEAFWLLHRPTGIVCIHCNAGMGRTGTVLCCLLLCEDSSLDAAASLSRIRGLRSGSVQTTKQEDFVREWSHRRLIS